MSMWGWPIRFQASRAPSGSSSRKRLVASSSQTYASSGSSRAARSAKRLVGAHARPFEIGLRQHEKRRTRGIVHNHLLAGPADDDDVVICARMVLDERDEWPPAIEMLPDPIADRARGGAEGERLPAALLYGGRKHIGTNAGCAPIH